jgi:hypothetical protein
MSEFKTKDEEGREIFKEYCANQSWCKFIKESKDEYATWDVSYMSGSTHIIGEIKMRNFESKAFDTWFLERKKLDALHVVREAVITKKKDVKAPSIQYINLFNDEVIRIWDITNLEMESKVIDLQATTFGDQSIKQKDTIGLPIETAVLKDGLYLHRLFKDVEIDDEDDDMLPF